MTTGNPVLGPSSSSAAAAPGLKHLPPPPLPAPPPRPPTLRSLGAHAHSVRQEPGVAGTGSLFRVNLSDSEGWGRKASGSQDTEKSRAGPRRLLGPHFDKH